jgi:hypothetical protein
MMIETDSIQMLSVECVESKKAQKASHKIEKRGLKKKRVFHERFGR